MNEQIIIYKDLARALHKDRVKLDVILQSTADEAVKVIIRDVHKDLSDFINDLTVRIQELYDKH